MEDKSKKFGEIIGNVFMSVIAGCMAAILVALTIKVVQLIVG